VIMTCHEVSGLLDPFVDGELDPRSFQTVSAHLNGCTDCHRTAERARDLKERIAGAVGARTREFDSTAFWKALEGRLPGLAVERKPSWRERAIDYWSGTSWAGRLVLAGAATAALAILAVRLIPYSEEAPSVVSSATVVASASGGVRIDRLRARAGTVAVWREPRYDTTVIWVAADGGEW